MEVTGKVAENGANLGYTDNRSAVFDLLSQIGVFRLLM